MKASFGGLDVSLAFIMLGASLGFLMHNFHPAKIFSGDSGSMFQGFMIATISLLGFKTISIQAAGCTNTDSSTSAMQPRMTSPHHLLTVIRLFPQDKVKGCFKVVNFVLTFGL